MNRTPAFINRSTEGKCVKLLRPNGLNRLPAGNETQYLKTLGTQWVWRIPIKKRRNKTCDVEQTGAQDFVLHFAAKPAKRNNDSGETKLLVSASLDYMVCLQRH